MRPHHSFLSAYVATEQVDLRPVGRRVGGGLTNEDEPGLGLHNSKT